MPYNSEVWSLKTTLLVIDLKVDMYGTIARLKAKEGALEQVRKMETGRQPAGFVKSFVFRSDNDPDELWLVAIFKDKASYQANAASPEQDSEYRQVAKYLMAEPEWHDGEVVFSSESS
jgi:quinol monooxygenase YgiN